MSPEEVPTSPGRRAPGAAHVYLHALVEDPAVVIDIVNFIHETRRTGVLTVVSGALRKSIYFHQGAVIAAASNQPEDRFGNIMVRLGLITQDDLERALREAGPHRRIGNVLMSRGVLSTKDLWRIIRVQIEEILFSVLLVNTGELTVAHFDPATVPNRTALNTQHVLLEGVRRKDEMEHMREELPAPDRVLVRHRHESGVTLEDNERRLYDLVDGRRTVADVCAACGLGEFESTRILHHLLKVGLVAAGSADATTQVMEAGQALSGVSANAIISAYNEAVRLIEAALRDAGHIGLIAHGVDSFFDDLDPVLGELFDGIVPASDGRLPPERLLTNLKISQSREKVRLLRRGLSEYARFLMFLARETLEFDIVEDLDTRVRTTLRGFDG